MSDTERTFDPNQSIDIGFSEDSNQSFEDKARIREAELNHELKMEQLDFDRMRYENARPKSDKEIELEYAYRNRKLDQQIAKEAYERTIGYKAEKYGTTAAAIVAVFGFFAWLFKKVTGD